MGKGEIQALLGKGETHLPTTSLGLREKGENQGSMVGLVQVALLELLDYQVAKVIRGLRGIR